MQAMQSRNGLCHDERTMIIESNEVIYRFNGLRSPINSLDAHSQRNFTILV